MRLKGKKIILGITGSIAAYKAAFLLRLFVKEGAEVQVVITEAGKEFITPVTLSALSGKPVMSQFFDQNAGSWNSHVEMGLWADVMIVAPATASTIARMAHGVADNLLVTTYMSVRCPVFVAPAMDMDMYAHSSTQRNLNLLRESGVHILEPGTGELASGLEGKGRMEEPEHILEKLAESLSQKKKLLNKTWLVTAGPTIEKIDPVRFIGNYSSGKMGYAIAEELARNGAHVILVSGPVSVKAKHQNIEVIHVESASQMLEACMKHYPHCNGAVMVAAVADFTPAAVLDSKAKRGSSDWILQLKPTPDIAAALGELKKENQLLIGFALETDNEMANARRKLEKKNLDAIVLNSLQDKGAGFGTDTNKITIIDKDNNIEAFELKGKTEVAADIVEKIVSLTG